LLICAGTRNGTSPCGVSPVLSNGRISRWSLSAQCGNQAAQL
jgi:hypothetical protein